MPEVTVSDYHFHQDQNYQGDHDISDSMWPEYCNPSYQMPDIIEVKVVTGVGKERDSYFFPVQILKAPSDGKAYLGGFRNKQSGQIYHHANSQTPIDNKKQKKINNTAKSRETQTYETRTLSVQPYRESGTQMERSDLRIDNKDDKVMYSKSYFTSEELLHLKKEKTIEIQRYWRGYMARVRAEQIRHRNAEYAMKVEEDKKSEADELMNTAKATLARRMQPKTNSDFALLYNELDSWRKDELAKIKASVTGEEEIKLAMSDLLASETKALQGMQRLKLEAQKQVHDEKTQQMLEEMAKPHQWQLSKGEIATVQTPETALAKKLLELYNQLRSPVQTVDPRLETLLEVKWAVAKFDSGLVRDIKDLIDREADLLNRGRPIASMESLRIRLKHLFLEFIQNPIYNPRASDFLQV